MEKKKRKKLGIRMARLIVVCILLLTVALAVFSYISFRKSFRSFYSDKAQNTAQMLAEIIDGNKIDTYLDTLEPDDYYRELEQLMSNMKADSNAAYVYIIYPEEDHFTYILDAYTEQDDKDNISHLGDVYEYGEMEYTYLLPDVRAKRASTDIILGADVGYGESVSAWAPVLDDAGNLTAMVEVDYLLTEVQEHTRTYVCIFVIVMLIGTVVILMLMLYFNNHYLTLPLRNLSAVIQSYEDGEFQSDGKEIRTGDEIEDVYETFVNMVGRINDYIDNITKITAEKERIGAELNVATQIQADMLPNIFPAFPEKKEIDIFATMRPAKEVGGDFYDFFLVDDTHIAFLIADVSGKGVPAALFMVIAKTIIKNHASNGVTVDKVFELTNNQLCEGNKEGFFVTSWLGILDLQTGVLEYANAGHNPPILMKQDGCQWIECTPGLVLAAMEDMPYERFELQIEPGDRILLYTDGVTESINTATEAYGEEHMIAEYEHTRTMSVEDSIHYMQRSIDDFVGEETQFDDITMLAIEYIGR